MYASGVFGFSPSELLKLAIYSNVVAFVGVLIGGYLNDLFSSKNILLICILFLIVAVTYGFLIAQTNLQYNIAIHKE